MDINKISKLNMPEYSSNVPMVRMCGDKARHAYNMLLFTREHKMEKQLHTFIRISNYLGPKGEDINLFFTDEEAIIERARDLIDTGMYIQLSPMSSPFRAHLINFKLDKIRRF